MGSLASKEKQPEELTRGQKLVEARVEKIERGEMTFLAIKNYPVRDQGAANIARYLEKDTCKCDIVQLEKCEINAWGCGEIAAALGSNTTVTDFTLIENKMGDQLPQGEAEDVFDQGLQMAAQMVFGSDAAKRLAESIRKHPVLQTVTLQENCLGNEGAEALAPALEEQASKTLIELTLMRNGIGDVGVMALSKQLALNTKLLKLDLQENCIGDEGGAALAAAIESNSTLTEVNLRANNLTSSVCVEFCKMLQVNKTLLELNLRRNAVKDTGCGLLSEAFKSNSGGLKRLMLSSNLIGDAGCAMLAGALEKNTVLEEVYLEINNIEDTGCIRLAEALEKNNILQKVDIKMNNFGGKAYNRLADAVYKNKTIRELDVSNSLMESKEPARKIAEALKNRSQPYDPNESSWSSYLMKK